MKEPCFPICLSFPLLEGSIGHWGIVKLLILTIYEKVRTKERVNLTTTGFVLIVFAKLTTTIQ